VVSLKPGHFILAKELHAPIKWDAGRALGSPSAHFGGEKSVLCVLAFGSIKVGELRDLPAGWERLRKDSAALSEYFWLRQGTSLLLSNVEVCCVILYSVLNMFRMLIHPSSGACDLFVELFHG